MQGKNVRDDVRCLCRDVEGRLEQLPLRADLVDRAVFIAKDALDEWTVLFSNRDERTNKIVVDALLNPCPSKRPIAFIFWHLGIICQINLSLFEVSNRLICNSVHVIRLIDHCFGLNLITKTSFRSDVLTNFLRHVLERVRRYLTSTPFNKLICSNPRRLSLFRTKACKLIQKVEHSKVTSRP